MAVRRTRPPQPLAPHGIPGHLVEFTPTKTMFTTPDNPDTEAYISGRFG